ncbi:MAG TPA: transposase [Anaerolineales bacterium]
MIDRFRREVYQSFEQRADAGMELIDALSSALTVESPVAQSESPLFRRRFSSVYDFLKQGRILLPQLRRVLERNQPEDAEVIAGYEVYAVDCTEDPAPAAQTLADRSQSKKGRHAPTQVGHRYSWLVRLVGWRTSWCMPQDIRRVSTATTDSQVGAEQVAALAAPKGGAGEPSLPSVRDRPGPGASAGCPLGAKVVVADSLYGNVIFLSIFLTVQHLFALVRLRSNRILYEEPPERLPRQKGRPRQHGCKFKLADPWRPPDRLEFCTLLGQGVRLTAWQGLHFYQLPFLVGMVLCVQFLKADGTPRFQRPLYLFWTGPTAIALLDLARIYLWRFAIEHMFRFFKQHLGLTSANSPDLEHRLRWVWCCALAYCQLLLRRHAVAQRRPDWHPHSVQGGTQGVPASGPPVGASPLTPRQVQRQALAFLLTLGSPARPAQPAGKGKGRPVGYRPQPRKRFPVVTKSRKRRKAA